MLITIEGIDGCGKTTLLEALKASITDLSPVFTREPGATWIGEQVRRAVAERVHPVTEALLFIADHAEHLDRVVRPALAEGRVVISDRFADSRYAYQSVTLEGLLEDPLTWLRSVHEGWTIRPDLTFLLVIPVEDALVRLAGNDHREHFEEEPVLRRVQENYLAFATGDPSRFVVIDALKPKEEIAEFVEAEIRRRA